MNKKIIFCFISFLLCLLSCENDITSSGSSTLDEADLVVVKVDTFAITSQVVPAGYIYAAPDSFLLGEVDTRFGTLHADLLTQFACPEGYQYPENAVVDSVCLFLYYLSHFGDANSPLALSAYEMDKATLHYDSAYTTAIDITQFCSLTPETEVVEKERIITANYYTDSVDVNNVSVPVIRMRTTDAFAQKFFTCRNFSSQDAFQKQFHGLYITPTFGSASVLNICNVVLSVYFHFDYQKQGRDTTVTDCKSFYANTEVRQVNRIHYTNVPTHTDLPDSLNYIVSPANIYTSISLPIHDMSEQIKANLTGKRPYVNLAQLRLPVLNVYTGSSSAITPDDWAQPADYLLLCRAESAERFFRKKELPTDTCALLGSLTAGVDTAGNVIYYYAYDLSTLLTQQLRNDTTSAESLVMTLIPVSVSTSSTTSTYYSSSSSTITGVSPLQTITTTVIPSAQSSSQPLNLEVVYSGF